MQFFGASARTRGQAFWWQTERSEMDNDELKNMVERMQWSLGRLAGAITPTDALPDDDVMGGKVSSLTEAVMGRSAGLVRIAEAIDGLADAVRDTGTDDRTVSEAIDGLTVAVRERDAHPRLPNQ